MDFISEFLHRLGFLDNVFGYIEYGIFIRGQYSEFLENVKKITGNEWNILRKDNILVAKNIRKVLVESQFFTSKEYDETKNIMMIELFLLMLPG